VSVRELADPSTVKMGEAASPSAGCSEVDADVVQIEATLRIPPPGHRHLLLLPLSARYFSRVAFGLWIWGGLPFVSPMLSMNGLLSHWQRRHILWRLLAGGWQCREVDGPELGGLRHRYDGQCRSWSSRVGLGLVLGGPGRGRSGGAHPSLCSASTCHLVRRRCLGGGSVSFG